MCILFAYAETGQGAVVMMIGDGGNGLFNDILRAIAHEYGWPDYRQRERATVATDPTGYDAYVGEYEVGGIRVTLSRTGDELFMLARPVWPQRLKLYPSGDDKFFLVDEDVDLSFVRWPGCRSASGNQRAERCGEKGEIDKLIIRSLAPRTGAAYLELDPHLP